MTDKKRNLTNKQRLFVAEYLVDLNATQAAIRAGYSIKNADKIGPENLRKPKIQKAIQEQMNARESRTLITADKVLEELAKIGFANLADYIQVQQDGTAYVDISGMTREQAAAVQEITVDEYTEGGGEDARQVKKVKLKLIDKIKALELIGKHLAMWVERQEITGKDGGPIEVAERSQEERQARIAELLKKRGGDQK
ncbi:MAG: terminase small subunit [Fastidiosipilaceae bacterium]|jgi:phage terminase small subunit